MKAESRLGIAAGDRVRPSSADTTRGDRLGANRQWYSRTVRIARRLFQYLSGPALCRRAGGLCRQPQPGWELAASRLGHVVACHPEAFADKSRFSMDWYYPVLGGGGRGAPPSPPLRGRRWVRGGPVRGIPASRHMSARWCEFVVPGLGARCVNDQPWVTGAETCELVLALDAIGDRERALDLYADIQHLRHDDGSYWTGWQFVDRAHCPAERSSWSAAAVVLAADALSGAPGGSGIFRNAAARPPPAAPVEP